MGSSSVFDKVKKRYYFEMLLPAMIAIIYSYFMWKNVLLPLYSEPVPNYVLIFILFGSMSLVYTLLAGTIEILLKMVRPDKAPLTWKHLFIYAVITAIIVGAFAGLLEFIYEIRIKREVIVSPGELLYVVDDSGSMHSNDPRNYRLSSVAEINSNLQGKTRVGLVRFSNKILFSSPIKELDSEYRAYISQNLYENTGGGTDIDLALKTAISLYQEDNVSSVRTRRILLLTDGRSNTKVDEDSVVSECKNMNINIDVISLGRSTDRRFINRITSKTGGHVCTVPSDYYINTAYKILMGERIDRCLLVPDILVSKHWLFLRIIRFVFLSMIGLSMNYVVTIMLRYRPYINRQLKMSWRLILIGAMIVTLRSATLFSILIMMALFLLPLFDGRIIIKQKERKMRLPKIKLKLPKFREDELLAGHGLYAGTIDAVEEGITVEYNNTF